MHRVRFGRVRPRRGLLRRCGGRSLPIRAPSGCQRRLLSPRRLLSHARQVRARTGQSTQYTISGPPGVSGPATHPPVGARETQMVKHVVLTRCSVGMSFHENTLCSRSRFTSWLSI